MGGFAAFFGGMGDDLAQMNRDRMQQRFAHNENQSRMLHDRFKDTITAYENLAKEYPDSPRMRDAIFDAHIALQGGDVSEQTLGKVSQQLMKAKQDLFKERAEAAVRAAAEGKQTPAVKQAVMQAQGGVTGTGVPASASPRIPPMPMPAPAQDMPPPPNANGNPFANMMAPPVAPGMAAQSPTSPLQGGKSMAPSEMAALQGGGNSPTAAFQSAEAPPPIAPAAGGIIPPVGAPGQPNINAITEAAPSLDAPVLRSETSASTVAPLLPNMDEILGNYYRDFQQTGQMAPALKAALDKQMGVQSGLEQKSREGDLTRAQGRTRVNDNRPLLDMLSGRDPLLGAVAEMELGTPGVQMPALPPAPGQHELSPGEALIGPDGKLLYLNPASNNPGTTPFATAKAAMETALGRTLNLEEIVDLDKKLGNGEPLYPVVNKNGTITYAPRSQAAGLSAPRTTYDQAGMPTTGGMSGISLTPPPPLPVSTQDQITGLKNSLTQFASIETMLHNPAYTDFGPAAGRLTLAEVSKLGGAGATPAQIELAVKLQRLLASQAFAEGGKALTPTELAQFVLTTPAMTDTIPQALIKTRAAIAYLRDRFQNRVSSIPERQRGQVDMSLPADAGAPPNVTTKQQYDALPSGTVYMEDGQKFRKP